MSCVFVIALANAYDSRDESSEIFSFTLIDVFQRCISIPSMITRVVDPELPDHVLSHALLLPLFFFPSPWRMQRGPGSPNISFKRTFLWEPFLHSDIEYSPPSWLVQRRPGSPNLSFELTSPVELFLYSRMEHRFPPPCLLQRSPGFPNSSFKRTSPVEPFLQSRTEHRFPPPCLVQRRPGFLKLIF